MAAILESQAPGIRLEGGPMPQRELGRFGWRASILTLGGVKWDTRRSDSEAVELIERALELGINTFDTAHSYGNGESERKLGMALDGVRNRVWINTKVIDRTYDGAKQQIETSLKRLRTDHIDLLFVHSLDDEENYQRILSPNGVLKAIEEYRESGHIRHVGISGHWVKHLMARIIQEYPFEAVLFAAGLFNVAYNYNFVDEVLPVARERGMAVLGMKVLGSGRAKEAPSVEPYLRYSLNLPIDTAVVGVDNIAQLEEIARIAKSSPPPLTESEIQALLPEAIRITQSWDEGEFDYVKGYREQ